MIVTFSNGIIGKKLTAPDDWKENYAVNARETTSIILCLYFDSAKRSPNFQQRANRSLQLAQNDVEIEHIY